MAMSEALRELQLCELDILKAIKRVCVKHKIRFVLASGTLLGAVRHQGFIPWDDDIDIEMPYQDYLRFQEIAQDELGDAYFLQSSETDPDYCFPYLRIQKKNTTLLREWDAQVPEYHRVWIDVFPLADLGGAFDFRAKRLILRTCAFLRMPQTRFDLNKDWLTQQKGKALYTLAATVRKLPEKFRWNLRKRLLHTVFRSRNTPDMTFVWTTVTRRIPREVYAEPDQQLWFEDDYYPVPQGYDTYLKILYKDYMQFPPPEKRKPPFTLRINLEHDWDPSAVGPDGNPLFELKTIEGQH